MQANGPRDLSFLFNFFALFLKTPLRFETRCGQMIASGVLMLGTLSVIAPGARAQEQPSLDSPELSFGGERHGGRGNSALEATPASVSITATVGSSTSQTIQLMNSIHSNVTISGVTVPSGGFRITGLSTPLTLAGGRTTTFSVVFSPETAGKVSGDLKIANTSQTLTVPVSGDGVAASKSISASPTSLRFGNVAVGTSSTETVTLSSTGNAGVTISAASASGTGISVSDNAGGIVLNPGQTATLNVEFKPTAAGTVTGSVTVSSNATNSPVTIAVSGTGTATTSYSVLLSWSASASSGVTGYNVYRGTTSGGPYSKIDPSLVSGLTYTDTTVTGGVEYYYVVTSLNSSGSESGYSSQVSASVP
jgi:hypothetical protein